MIDFGSAQEVELRFGGGNVSPAPSAASSSGSSSHDGAVTSPEFHSPEVISSGPVGTYTDMWGFGVLLYVALRFVLLSILISIIFIYILILYFLSFSSGLSPFLDDSDDETTNNVLRCDFSFPSEYFSDISTTAKDLIGRLLTVNPTRRPSASICRDTSAWFQSADRSTQSKISSIHLSTLVRRRMKKLNTVAPAFHMQQTSVRPDSIYKKL